MIFQIFEKLDSIFSGKYFYVSLHILKNSVLLVSAKPLHRFSVLVSILSIQARVFDFFSIFIESVF